MQRGADRERKSGLVGTPRQSLGCDLGVLSYSTTDKISEGAWWAPLNITKVDLSPFAIGEAEDGR